jgi:hypothetical protein
VINRHISYISHAWCIVHFQIAGPKARRVAHKATNVMWYTFVQLSHFLSIANYPRVIWHILSVRSRRTYMKKPLPEAQYDCNLNGKVIKIISVCIEDQRLLLANRTYMPSKKANLGQSRRGYSTWDLCWNCNSTNRLKMTKTTRRTSRSLLFSHA